MNRSETLKTRLADVERRLKAMRTVTNTASAEISGGETIIDDEGSLIFEDGGRLRLEGSVIETTTGKTLIDSGGNLVADSVIIYGDVLSARDYMLQRETIEETLIDTELINTTKLDYTLDFPDWASKASIVATIAVNSRVRTREGNPLLVSFNGKPVSRPRTDSVGNVMVSTSVVRRVLPDNPEIRISLTFSEETVPSASPKMRVKLGGVYTA